MVSIRQLEYFCAVIEHGSFTAAAEQLHVSQPGLSHQIKALETALGGALLERATRGARLTALGRAVFPHASAAIADVARVTDTAARVVAGTGGTLEVATINSLSLGVLPGVLRVWRANHPDVAVAIAEYSTVEDVLDSLQRGTADLAVTPLPDTWTGLRRHVGVEEFAVAIPADHRLARRRTRRVRLAELADDTWVHFEPSHGLAGVLDHVARQAGFVPRAAMRTSQTAAATEYAAAGVGSTLVPANLIRPGFPGRILWLDPPITRDVWIIVREPDDTLATRFADTAIDAAELTPAHLL